MVPLRIALLLLASSPGLVGRCGTMLSAKQVVYTDSTVGIRIELGLYLQACRGPNHMGHPIRSMCVAQLNAGQFLFFCVGTDIIPVPAQLKWHL